MDKIFISYASVEKEIAYKACKYLENHGKSCWIAPRDIPAGSDYGAEIIKGLEESRALVLLFSAASNDSQHVLREVERAVSKKIPIIVYRLDGTEPSKSLEYFLYTTQWLDASNKAGSRFHELDESLNLILNQKDEPESLKIHGKMAVSEAEFSRKAVEGAGAPKLHGEMTVGYSETAGEHEKNKRKRLIPWVFGGSIAAVIVIALLVAAVLGKSEDEVSAIPVSDNQEQNIAQEAQQPAQMGETEEDTRTNPDSSTEAGGAGQDVNSDDGKAGQDGLLGDDKTNDTLGNDKSDDGNLSHDKLNDSDFGNENPDNGSEKDKKDDGNSGNDRPSGSDSGNENLDNGSEKDKKDDGNSGNDRPNDGDSGKDNRKDDAANQDDKTGQENNLKPDEKGNKTAAENLKIGEYVILGQYFPSGYLESMGNGEIRWQVICNKKDSLLLLSEDILDIRVYDAAESGRFDKDLEGKLYDRTKKSEYSDKKMREYRGSNLWETSDLCAWLNSDGVVKYPGKIPVDIATDENANSNGTQKGFLTDFSKKERELLSGSVPVTLLSLDEVAQYVRGREKQGISLYAKPTKAAVASDKSSWYANYQLVGEAYLWSLRTPGADGNASSVSAVSVPTDSNEIITIFAAASGHGIRPAIWVKTKDVYFSGDGSSKKPYQLK